MRSEQQVREQIAQTIKDFKYLLDLPLAKIQINAPRALMQISVVAQLDALYFVLNEERPKFVYDKERS